MLSRWPAFVLGLFCSGSRAANISGADGPARITVRCAQVTFDPSQVTFNQLLEVFFQRHDPTQLNRQVTSLPDRRATLMIALPSIGRPRHAARRSL